MSEIVVTKDAPARLLAKYDAALLTELELIAALLRLAGLPIEDIRPMIRRAANDV